MGPPPHSLRSSRPVTSATQTDGSSFPDRHPGHLLTRLGPLGTSSFWSRVLRQTPGPCNCRRGTPCARSTSSIRVVRLPGLPGRLTVFTPQPREAGGGAEFQRSRLLLPCHI